jgi:hypothetical protein
MTQKKQKLSWKLKNMCIANYNCRANLRGYGWYTSTAYKAEIDVKWSINLSAQMTPQFAAKMKRKLEKVLVGAKVKQCLLES